MSDAPPGGIDLAFARSINAIISAGVTMKSLTEKWRSLLLTMVRHPPVFLIRPHRKPGCPYRATFLPWGRDYTKAIHPEQHKSVEPRVSVTKILTLSKFLEICARG